MYNNHYLNNLWEEVLLEQNTWALVDKHQEHRPHGDHCNVYRRLLYQLSNAFQCPLDSNVINTLQKNTI